MERGADTLPLVLIPVFCVLFSVRFASGEEDAMDLIAFMQVSESFFSDISLAPWACERQRDSLGCI